MPRARHLRPLTTTAAATVLAFSGCGGGSADPGPSDDTERADAAARSYERELARYATKAADAPQDAELEAAPKLDAVAGRSPSLDRARVKADRVAAISDELRQLGAIDAKRVSSQYFKLYGLASDQYSRNLDAGAAFNRRYLKALPAPSRARSLAAVQARGRKQDRIIHDTWVAGVRKTIASWRAYAGRVADVPARDDLERSTLAAERDALDRSIDTFRDFADHLDTSEPGSDQIPFYKEISAKQNPYPIVALAPKRYARQLSTALREDLAAYADPRASLDRSPTVGDAYRKVIRAAFLSPAKKRSKDAAQRNVDGRLWLLSRARQLEDTPEETYEAARRALYLEAADDPRDSYLPLILIVTELKGILVITKADVAKVRAFKSWADGVLDQPVVPLLEPTRDALRERVDAITTEGSEYDVRASQTKQSRRMTTELRKGARALDAPKGLRSQLEAALDATRP